MIADTAVPGKSQLLVFATPKAHGIYQGFAHDAIAIAYQNSDIVDVLDISAFDGNAQSFIIHPDGRVDRKSTRLNSSHSDRSRMPSSA